MSPPELYDYLLSHEKQYSMEVIRLEPIYYDPSSEFDKESVLVQISSHRVNFRDDQVAILFFFFFFLF